MTNRKKKAHFRVYFVFWVQNLQGDETKEEREICTLDGTIDWHGQPAIRSKTGGWVAGIIILCKTQNHFLFNFFVYLNKPNDPLSKFTSLLFHSSQSRSFS